MFIKIFVILSLAYYIMRLFKPDFYIEMMLKDFLDRNKDCRTMKDLQDKLDDRSRLKDAGFLCLTSLFVGIHMILELVLVLILIFKYKSSISFVYLVFWVSIFIKRKINKNKNKKMQICEFDAMRISINKCYKISERAIVLFDSTFFMYIFINMILVGA